jgi:hypothetical protein
MQETTIVFITLLLLLIITCIFGGSMRQTPVVSPQHYNNYNNNNSIGSFGLPPMESFDGEGDDAAIINDDEEMDPLFMPHTGEEDLPVPSLVRMDTGGIEGMMNSHDKDDKDDGPAPPEAYISEEFASY